jgi:RNA polymerase sigma-70 factor, ECF subfamily
MEAEDAREASAEFELAPELQFSGGQEILSEVFSRRKSQLYRTAFRVLRSHEDAEDAVQDGLLAAIRNLASFEGRAQFSTWLTRIVVNAALMRRRKVRGHITTSIDKENQENGGILGSTLADPSPDPEQTYARWERRRKVRQWLKTLPAPQRAALWLRHVEGMTTQEAAEALRVSEGTLKSRLHRGRLELFRRFHEAPPACTSHAPHERPERRSRSA